MDLLTLKILLGDKGPGDSVTVPAEDLRGLIAMAENESDAEEAHESGYWRGYEDGVADRDAADD